MEVAFSRKDSRQERFTLESAPMRSREMPMRFERRVRPLYYVPEGLSRRTSIHTIRGVIHDDESPIKGVSFALFRRLGFALWDDQRLAALGLDHAPLERGKRYVPTGGPSKYWYSWRSLLSAEELAQAETRLEESEQAWQAWLNHERSMATGSRDLTVV